MYVRGQTVRNEMKFDRRGKLALCSILVAVLLVGGFLAMAGPVAAHEGHEDGEDEDGENVTTTSEGENVTVTIDDDGEAFSLEPAPEQVVTGSISLEEGTEIRVVVVVMSDTPFQRTQQTEVGPGGTFAATFDLSDAPPDTQFMLLVEYETDSETVVVDDRVKGTIASTNDTPSHGETTSTDGQAGPGILGAVLAGVVGLVLVTRQGQRARR